MHIPHATPSVVVKLIWDVKPAILVDQVRFAQVVVPSVNDAHMVSKSVAAGVELIAGNVCGSKNLKKHLVGSIFFKWIKIYSKSFVHSIYSSHQKNKCQ